MSTKKVFTWDEIRSNHVIYEDDAILVLNKPVGISVVGEHNEADLITLARNAGENLMPVHRIDKVTSGATLFAKSVNIHANLTRQFNKRTVDKTYLAITKSTGLPEHGTIDLPLSIGRKNKVRVAAERENIIFNQEKNLWSIASTAIFSEKRTYPSITKFTKLFEDKKHTVLILKPITGRRHQIRTHLAWIGHPIEGDPLFMKNNDDNITRTYLHSWRLAFDTIWSKNKRIEIEASPEKDFWNLLENIEFLLQQKERK